MWITPLRYPLVAVNKQWALIFFGTDEQRKTLIVGKGHWKNISNLGYEIQFGTRCHSCPALITVG